MPEPTIPDAAVQAAAVAIFQTSAMGDTGFSRLARAALEAAAPLLAQHILRVAEIGGGSRCPRCHGAPASIRWSSGRTRSYRCGCGHRWRPRTYGEVRQWEVRGIVRRIADGGGVPPLPAKVGCAQCASGEPHA